MHAMVCIFIASSIKQISFEESEGLETYAHLAAFLLPYL